MTRVVLDTNVLISALLAPGGAPAKVLRLWRQGTIAAVTSEALLHELERAVGDLRLRPQYEPPLSHADELVQSLRETASVVAGALHVVGVCRDPADDSVLACALEGGAEYIVTGDRDLLAVGSYQGVRILDPPAFLQALAAE